MERGYEENVRIVAAKEEHRSISRNTPGSRRRSARPAGVTLLALGVLSIGGLNLLRFIQALRQWVFLQTLLPISPLYLALTGLVWAGSGLALAWGLVRGRPWALRFTLPGALAYSLYFWADRLLLSAERSGSNWLFAAGMNVLLLVLMLWILSRRRARAFFRTETSDSIWHRE